MRVNLVKKSQFSWKTENYVIAGLGLLLWMLPGLLYIYLVNREIDGLRAEKRHKELLAVLNKLAALTRE